jgi:hypothetical protein
MRNRARVVVLNETSDDSLICDIGTLPRKSSGKFALSTRNLRVKVHLLWSRRADCLLKRDTFYVMAVVYAIVIA